MFNLKEEPMDEIEKEEEIIDSYEDDEDDDQYEEPITEVYVGE